MKIITQSELFKPEGIAKIEEMKNATFVCDTCLRASGGGWVNDMVAVFANNSPTNIPCGGSRWFGLYFSHSFGDPGVPSRLMITNAISATEPFKGVVAENGDVIYSRYRHDYRVSPDGSVWVDGGRDYLRTGPSFGIVDLQIKGDKLVVI